MDLNTPEELIQDMRLGRMVILMDDEDRENEGDLVIAAECVRPEDINFMAVHARGLICMPMTRERCKQLNLPLMVDHNQSGYGTKFTVSIEAAHGVTTGISAADRATTVRAAASRNARPEDIVQPGHIFPLMAEPGGVLTRAGHTEAACDLARMAGFEPAGVICEIIRDDGTMARRDDLEQFANKHKLKIGTIADLIHYRMLHEHTIEKLSVDRITTDYGTFDLHAYRGSVRDDIHLALVKGEIDAARPCLVRVQDGSTIRDLLRAQRPDDDGWNLGRSLEAIAREGGVVVLLASNETAADISGGMQIARGLKSVPTGERGEGTYLTVGIGSQILRDLGVGKLSLMAKPVKYNALSGFDLEVVEFRAPDGGSTQP